MVDALLEHTPHLTVNGISVGSIGRPQQRWDEIWCVARQKLHGVTSSVSWSIVLLESEEVFCYGTNRRQKVLTEQDVTVISGINFYTRLNEHQIGRSKYRHGDRDHERFWESGQSTQETLGCLFRLPSGAYTRSFWIGIFHTGNFCFWVPFSKQLLLRNCSVDFVEICNVYIGKMIIKADKSIL